MKNTKGFALIEGLLILAIIAILGGTGWYVWNARNKTDNNLNNANAASNSIPSSKIPQQGSDSTTGWLSYSTKQGNYSLKYPSTWHRPEAEELCGPNLLMMGPLLKGDSTIYDTGKCGSDGAGQISLSWSQGESSQQSPIKAEDGYADITSARVEADRVQGDRQTAVASGQDRVNLVNPMSDGTKVVRYVFYTNGKTYVATYIQAEDNQDVLSDFDLMITKTLKFSST